MAMLGRLVFLLGGLYGGIYIDQNYTVPKVDDPQELWSKFNEWMEQYKKK